MTVIYKLAEPVAKNTIDFFSYLIAAVNLKITLKIFKFY